MTTIPEIRGETHKRAVTLPPLPSEVRAAGVRKRCSSCGGMCSERDFRPDRRSSDGLRSQCRHCESDAERARYLRRLATDPESMRDRNVMAGRRYRARLATGAA